MKRYPMLVAAGFLFVGCQEGGPLPTGTDPETGGRLSLAACTAPPAGLLSWWTGDGHPNDIEGHNHGSLQNGATFAPGEVGQAFSLDGADDHVFLGVPADLKVTTGLTIDAWVRPTASRSNGSLVGVLTKWNQDANLSATADSYALWLQSTGVNYQVFTGVHTTDGGEPIISGGAVPLDTWTHVAVTYDAATGFLAAYVDGVLVVSNDGADLDIHATDADMAIGREMSGATRAFPGLIDEVEVFDRALSEAEIDAIVAAGASGKCKPICDGRVVTTTGTVNGGQIDLTEGDDVWLGTAAAEMVLGLGGDDRMCGEGGSDNLLGGAGFDRLFGGDGADVLEGGPDDDRLEGGAGDDELYGATAAAPDAAGSGDDQLRGDDGADQLFGGDGADQLQGDAGVDLLEGGEGADQLLGGDDGDVLNGGPGDDELRGNAGDDELYGATAAAPDAAGSGNDELRGDDGVDQLYGGDGADELQGGAGDDRLEGGDGADALFGGDGDDALRGGAGGDRLRGGAGADAFKGQGGIDRAQDFVCGVDTTDGTVERGIPNCP